MFVLVLGCLTRVFLSSARNFSVMPNSQAYRVSVLRASNVTISRGKVDSGVDKCIDEHYRVISYMQSSIAAF